MVGGEGGEVTGGTNSGDTRQVGKMAVLNGAERYRKVAVRGVVIEGVRHVHIRDGISEDAQSAEHHAAVAPVGLRMP